MNIEEITLEELRLELEQLKENGIDFFVDEAWLLEHERDLESVNEQFLSFFNTRFFTTPKTLLSFSELLMILIFKNHSRIIFTVY